MACYISLGSDCSVSYHLRRLGYQIYGSMPFDWMKIDNLTSVSDILESRFESFLDIQDSYDIRDQSHDKFDTSIDPSIDTGIDTGIDTSLDPGQTCCKSYKKMVHRRYKFTLPHEFREDILDSQEFIEKYSRRIARFNDVCKDADIRKVFVRLGNSKEVAKNKEKNKIDILADVLDKCGYRNYEIKFINMDLYKLPLNMEFEWKRHYIPWYELLIDS